MRPLISGSIQEEGPADRRIGALPPSAKFEFFERQKASETPAASLAADEAQLHDNAQRLSSSKEAASRSPPKEGRRVSSKDSGEAQQGAAARPRGQDQQASVVFY